MKIEFYKRPGLSEDPNYQKGLELGSKALNPLSALQPADNSPIAGRKEFLAGYAVALENYIKNKDIILPIGISSPKYEIDFPPFLSGIITGLERGKPNSPEFFKFQGSDPQDPQVWADTWEFLEGAAKKDGYMIGFLASLARDYGIISHGHAIPTNNTQYQTYLEGLDAKPSHYFLVKGNDHLGWMASEEYSKRIYLTGLKVWIVQHGLGICPILLTHPETLEAFKKGVETKGVPVSDEQSPEAQIGYQLAKMTPTIPAGKWPKQDS